MNQKQIDALNQIVDLTLKHDITFDAWMHLGKNLVKARAVNDGASHLVQVEVSEDVQNILKRGLNVAYGEFIKS